MITKIFFFCQLSEDLVSYRSSLITSTREVHMWRSSIFVSTCAECTHTKKKHEHAWPNWRRVLNGVFVCGFLATYTRCAWPWVVLGQRHAWFMENNDNLCAHCARKSTNKICIRLCVCMFFCRWVCLCLFGFVVFFTSFVYVCVFVVHCLPEHERRSRCTFRSNIRAQLLRGGCGVRLRSSTRSPYTSTTGTAHAHAMQT